MIGVLCECSMVCDLRREGFLEQFSEGRKGDNEGYNFRTIINQNLCQNSKLNSLKQFRGVHSCGCHHEIAAQSPPRCRSGHDHAPTDRWLSALWLVAGDKSTQHEIHTRHIVHRNSHSASRWFVLHIFFRGVSKSVKRMSCALIDDPTCPSLHTTLYLHPDKYLIVAAARDILSTLVTYTTTCCHPHPGSGGSPVPCRHSLGSRVGSRTKFHSARRRSHQAFLLVASIYNLTICRQASQCLTYLLCLNGRLA